MKFLVSIWYKIIFEPLPILVNSDTQTELIPASDFHFGKLTLPQFVHELGADSDQSIYLVGLNTEGLNNGSDTSLNIISNPQIIIDRIAQKLFILANKSINNVKSLNSFLLAFSNYFFLPFPLTLSSASYASCREWGHLARTVFIATLLISAVVGQNEHFLNSKTRRKAWQQQQIPL